MRRPMFLLVLLALALTTRQGDAAGYADGLDGYGFEGGTQMMSSGANQWQVGSPEAHGVSPEDLRTTETNLNAIPGRSCLVIVKNGELLLESYDTARGVDDSTKHVTDSIGSIALVAITGSALQRGLFSLDQPILSYGLTEVLTVFGPSYAKHVTVRHLLTQTHGGGEVPPGTVFRHDDDAKFVNLLFSLIEKQSGVSLAAFAQTTLGDPMGLDVQSLFAHRGDTRRITATCRELSKFAQLFLNKGVWEGGDGVQKQILSPKYSIETFSPNMNFKNVNKAFGLLAWTHEAQLSGLGSIKSKIQGTTCCAPVTSMTPCGESAEQLNDSILGNVVENKVGIFLGNQGSAVFIVPDSNTAVISIGRTVMGSAKCPVQGLQDVLGVNRIGKQSERRDDYALLRTLWRAVAPATRSVGMGKQSEGYGGDSSVMQHTTVYPSQEHTAVRRHTSTGKQSEKNSDSVRD